MYNGHGDVTALLDSTTGGIAGTYYYDAFGNILEKTGTVNNNTTYAGYQWDAESGLYYLNARYYDPKIARFLSEDTILGDHNDPLSLNLYTYCHNEPIMYMDPTGNYEITKDKDGNTYAVIEKDDTLGGIAQKETGNAGNWTKIGYGRNERTIQLGEKINISGLWGSGNSTATQKGTTTPPAAITGPEGLKSSAAVGTQRTSNAGLDKKLPSFTVSVQEAGSLGFGIGVTGSGGAAIDGEGNVVGIWSLGGGGTTPAMGYSWQIQITNAKSVESLRQWGVEVGGSATVLGVGAGIEYVTSKNEDGTVWSGVTISFGPNNVILPAEVHGNLTYTWERGLSTDEIASAKDMITSKLEWLNDNLSNEVKSNINNYLGGDYLTDTK